MAATGAAVIDTVGSWFATDAAAAAATDVAATATTDAAAAAAAADATAMGSAAGTLGAVDSAAASQALGLTAADVGAGAGAGIGTAMGSAAGTLGAVDSQLASGALGLTGADVGAATGIAPWAAPGLPLTGGGAANGAGVFLPVTGTAGISADGTMALSSDMSSALLGPDLPPPTDITALSNSAVGDTLLGGSGAGFDTAMGPASGVLGGVDTMTGITQDAAAGFSPTGDPTLMSQLSTGISNLGSHLGDVGSWAANHPLSTAGLGLSLLNGMRTPKLPAQANAASGAATAEVNQAQAILASGGTSSPQWSTMKTSIDASIQQEVQQATQQILQTAANSGMGGTDSGVVQQMLSQMKLNAAQKQAQMYDQALQSIVSQAVSELSGGNQVLTSIAGMQMQQDAEARQLASQIAEASLMLALPGG